MTCLWGAHIPTELQGLLEHHRIDKAIYLISAVSVSVRQLGPVFVLRATKLLRTRHGVYINKVCQEI